MTVNIPALIVTIFLFMFVLGIGIWASLKSKKLRNDTHSQEVEVSFLANRTVSLTMGMLSMTATWVGGAYFTGIAESVYDPTKGLIWSLIPLQTSISIIIGGLVFAKPMREKKYISMMDPFQRKYGKPLTAVFSVVPVMSEIVWIPASLICLGATMSLILGLPFSICIWISAAVTITYTVLGGLYSVTYTDIIQLLLILVTLCLCVPFILTSGFFTDITQTAVNHTYQAPWLGHLTFDQAGRWADNFLLMSMGNLAMQDFHQRTLSSRSTSTARVICFIAGGAVIIAGIPPVVIGAVAASTDWNSTPYGCLSPYERGEGDMVMLIVFQHLTPTFINIFGMVAIVAAVMSTTDSLLLSATTIFTTNIYRTIRSKSSDKELQWVIRLSIIVTGLAATALTNLSSSTLAFWILGSDMSYTIMLPQLICVLFIDVSNGYGATAGFLVSIAMRVLCGEPLIGLPAILRFPDCILEDGVYTQRWPFKTICMLASLASILLCSYISSVLFKKGVLPDRWDVFLVNSQRVSTPADDSREANRDETAIQPMLDLKYRK